MGKPWEERQNAYRLNRHLTSTETLHIGQRRMRADENVVLLREQHSLVHDIEIAVGREDRNADVVSCSRAVQLWIDAAYEAWKPQAMLARWIVFIRASSSPMV